MFFIKVLPPIYPVKYARFSMLLVGLIVYNGIAVRITINEETEKGEFGGKWNKEIHD